MEPRCLMRNPKRHLERNSRPGSRRLSPSTRSCSLNLTSCRNSPKKAVARCAQQATARNQPDPTFRSKSQLPTLTGPVWPQVLRIHRRKVTGIAQCQVPATPDILEPDLTTAWYLLPDPPLAVPIANLIGLDHGIFFLPTHVEIGIRAGGIWLPSRLRIVTAATRSQQSRTPRTADTCRTGWRSRHTVSITHYVAAAFPVDLIGVITRQALFAELRQPVCGAMYNDVCRALQESGFDSRGIGTQPRNAGTLFVVTGS